MSLIKAAGAGEVSTGFYSYCIDQSLRFNEDDAPRLTRSIGTPTNETVWTFSCWLKRSTLNSVENADHPVVSGGTNASNYEVVGFWNSTDDVIINSTSTGSRNTNTTQVFRDLSSWYHLVVQRNDANQVIYINGEAVNTISNASSSDSYINKSGHTMTVGCHVPSLNTVCFDGYLADVVFVDGTAVPISSLGETINGIWVAKDPSGLTFGNNGYYLKFADSSALGTDSAGNGSFSTNGVAASDVVPDSPNRNFATMNPLMIGDARVHSSAVYSEGNLKVACGGFSTSTIGGGYSTIAIPKDKKIYCEVYEPNQAGNLWGAGVIIDNHVQASNQIGGNGTIAYYNRSVFLNGTENDYGSSSGVGGLGVAKLAAGDVLGIAVDGATGKVWFHRNGTYFGAPVGHQSGHGTTGNPSAGSNEIGTITNTTAINPSGEIFIYLTGNGSVDDLFVNFGQDSTFAGNESAGSETDANGEGLFQYAVPTDYVCLHSGNMSDITIGSGQSSQADDNFNTVLYTGDGSSSNAITVGFQPDWTWIKQRDGTPSHALFDSVRGADNVLRTNGTEEENNSGIATATFGGLTSFDSNGFTVDDGSSTTFDATNGSGDSYVAWNWKAGGSASSNSDGSITSSVSAAPDAGFSIVSYTGTGANATVGHGLSSAPEMYIVKGRAASNWSVYHSGIASDAETDFLILNSTSAAVDLNTYWNDTAPTSSVFSLGTDSNVNGNTATFIAYCFHSVDGYSKVGNYVGNGNADGTFVYTGFRPAFVLLKVSSTTNNWFIYDNKREGYNEDNDTLSPNLSAVEDNSYKLDLLSNGFKIRGSQNAHNQSGQTFIYLAFAEAPFKFANAR